MHRVDLEHFTLWSQRELQPSDLDATRQNLQNVRREVGRAFGGFFPADKFDVILTEETVFRTYSGMPEHVKGYFNGTIHLPILAKGSGPRLKAVLHHEYTHALLWAAGKGRCPTWIQEGFAVDREESVDPIRKLSASRLVRDGRLVIPLAELDERLSPGSTDPAQTILAYEVAYAVIRHLRSAYRPAELLRWVRSMGDGVGWETAVQRSFRMSPDKIEREVAARLLGASE